MAARRHKDGQDGQEIGGQGLSAFSEDEAEEEDTRAHHLLDGVRLRAEQMAAFERDRGEMATYGSQAKVAG